MGVNPYRCPRCHNQDLVKVGMKQGQPYCRACLPFQAEAWVPRKREKKAVQIQLGYALTIEQQTIADGLIACYRQQQSAMVDAVTGSGKTEIVFGLIQIALAEGKRIGFVIPRRDVVQEMVPRFQQVFPSLTITAVFGGHHDQLEADLIILTTHQIFRYEHYFDVLIFDEVDAFPYAGNPVLFAMVQRASQGMIVYLSATFEKQQLIEFSKQGGKVFHLFKRYHGHPLPTLTILIRPFFLKWITLLGLLFQFHQQRVPVFIFVPTISIGQWLLRLIRVFFPTTKLAFSSSVDREEVVRHFKNHPDFFLVTTAILERGITVSKLQAIIFEADHRLYTTSMLIQMAGRVGRKLNSPTGRVILLANYQSPSIQYAQAKIKFANDHM
jgi:competence protein ComFA